MTSTSESGTRRHRIEVRVTPEQEALIREAAQLEHETVTAFVLTTATDRARRLLDQRRTMTLPNEDFDRFFAALDEPETVVPELVDLFRTEQLPLK